MDDSVTTEPLGVQDSGRLSLGQRLHQASLVTAMFVGANAIWAGAPALWLWLAGRTGKVSESQMGALVMVIVGIPATMIFIGKILARLDHRYTTYFGQASETNIAAARWLRSVRGGGEEEPPTMLDKVLVIAVAFGLLAVGAWFVFFSAGSQAPR